jgi:Protein of unknown function (DUF3892)
MSDYLITCINKPDRLNSHDRIQYIGNAEQSWKTSVVDAIACMRRGDTFYTIDRTTGRRVEIGIVEPPGRAPFIQTHADGKWNDNLLAQKECGANCRIV